MSFKDNIQPALMSLILMVIVLSGIVAVYFLANPITINLNGTKLLPDDMPYYGEVSDWMVVAERFAANNEYIGDNENYICNKTTKTCIDVRDNTTHDRHNCVDYTNELYDIARDLGFNVRKVIGCKYTDDTDCHAWLRFELDFEPQTGKFKDYSKEYEVRE